MVKLSGPFSRLGRRKILVVGDLMLDSYTIGKARRISPEAPVAVVQVQQEEMRPGGAGNAMLNIISLGCDVVAVGRIGKDTAGCILKDALIQEGIDVRGIFTQEGFLTPVKNRIIAEGQQIVRIDHEKILPLPEMLEQQVIEMLPALFEGVQIAAISDYGKGFLSRTLLASLIDCAKQKGISVIADPKGIDFTKYAGTTILKPNLGEAYAAANLPTDAPLELAAAKVLDISQADTLMITRSESGISLFHQNGNREDFPVHAREVKDVTGAGDTVLAMLATSLANELDLDQAVKLSNIAAGIAIEHFGCARVTLSDLARRLLEYDVVNKVFDEEHIFALRQALKDKPFTMLGISGAEALTAKLYGAIQVLSQKGKRLLVFVKDVNPDKDFINLLASICDIDFIIVNAASLKSLCQEMEPDGIYSFENDRLISLENPKSLMLLS